QTGQPDRVFPVGNNPVKGIAFSPDGQRLAIASDQGVMGWDVNTRQTVLHLRADTRTASSVAYSPDGKHLVTGGADGTVNGGEGVGGGGPLPPRAQAGGVRARPSRADSRRPPPASKDNTVRVGDPAPKPGGLALRERTGPAATAVAFSPDGKRLASIGWD